MKRFNVELFVGLFLIAGFLSFLYLAIRLGEVEIFSTGDYTVKARFASVSGLKLAAVVEIAGVPVGKVKSISLDKGQAVVEMQISSKLKLPEDSIASIRTMGIIGDKYIKISLGGSDNDIHPGGWITETESSVDLEEILSKYIFGKI
jgi:phospholipid/cholesterol/gamma-HCH transport system substrate-binding protein